MLRDDHGFLQGFHFRGEFGVLLFDGGESAASAFS
jgi:hypothetical protein